MGKPPMAAWWKNSVEELLEEIKEIIRVDW